MTRILTSFLFSLLLSLNIVFAETPSVNPSVTLKHIIIRNVVNENETIVHPQNDCKISQNKGYLVVAFENMAFVVSGEKFPIPREVATKLAQEYTLWGIDGNWQIGAVFDVNNEEYWFTTLIYTRQLRDFSCKVLLKWEDVLKELGINFQKGPRVRA